MEEFASDQIMFFPQEGFCMVECLLMVSSATIGINFGFNDDQLEDSNLLATSLSGTTWTSNATEFVAWSTTQMPRMTTGIVSGWMMAQTLLPLLLTFA